MHRNEVRIASNEETATERFPLLFIGHGSPMNAIETNEYVDAWKQLSRTLPTPRAILVISAHWLTNGTRIFVGDTPRTIHDFYGFPPELYAVTYDAPGSPQYANRAYELLSFAHKTKDNDWGLDHGSWVPLLHISPEANIPVFQMSIDMTRTPREHVEIGSMLRALRTQGVLIMGSGNIVHNLGAIAWGDDASPFDWAIEADKRITDLLLEGNHNALIDYHTLGSVVARAIPTPEHYLPLLYLLGLMERDEHISFPVVGIAHGSISMRSIRIG